MEKNSVIDKRAERNYGLKIRIPRDLIGSKLGLELLNAVLIVPPLFPPLPNDVTIVSLLNGRMNDALFVLHESER